MSVVCTFRSVSVLPFPQMTLRQRPVRCTSRFLGNLLAISLVVGHMRRNYDGIVCVVLIAADDGPIYLHVCVRVCVMLHTQFQDTLVCVLCITFDIHRHDNL